LCVFSVRASPLGSGRVGDVSADLLLAHSTESTSTSGIVPLTIARPSAEVAILDLIRK
jgi:hypothetical protein